MHTPRAIVLMALVLACALPSLASSSEIRRIAQTDATSDCIGDPRTALCAVETFMACSVRRDIRLCRAVGVAKLDFFEQRYNVEYFVTRSIVQRSEDTPEESKSSPWAQPGVVRIDIEERFCEIDFGPCANASWTSFNYWAKRTDDRWSIVGWSMVDGPI